MIVEGDAPDERGLVHDEALRREDDAIGRQIHDRPFLNGDVADFFAALLIVEGLPLRVGVARSKNCSSRVPFDRSISTVACCLTSRMITRSV